MSRLAVRDYIDKLGGVQSVAALAHVEPTTASAWQTRLGRFPPDTFVLFRDELRRRGHLADGEEPPLHLWRMKQRRLRKRGPRGDH